MGLNIKVRVISSSLSLFCAGCENAGEKQRKCADAELVESVRFSFSVESLGLLLYNNDPSQVSLLTTASSKDARFV